MTTTKPIILDASPLGRLAKARPHPDDLRRLDGLLAAHVRVLVSEVADYEVRRSLLLHNLTASVQALDMLRAHLVFVPITSAVMGTAAELWADARRAGQPTADPKELDCDVILAAQAMEADAIVATENVGHLSRYVTAVEWRLIAPAPSPP